jgi:hypothetical protein
LPRDEYFGGDLTEESIQAVFEAGNGTFLFKEPIKPSENMVILLNEENLKEIA